MRNLSALTKTELAVMSLVAQGLRNREIAKRLYNSPRTIDAHLRNVFDKLEVRNRMEAVNKLKEDKYV